MPDDGTHIPADIRALLAKATPEQLEKLLWDIMMSSPKPREGVHYDA